MLGVADWLDVSVWLAVWVPLDDCNCDGELVALGDEDSLGDCV
jgi:hypothetical protein